MVPVQGGVGTAFKNMLLSHVNGMWRPGMQLPNFARCSRNLLPPEDRLYGTTAEDQNMLGSWLSSMMRFEKNSHLRGTCLLTGQQPTVDMTSNYKTSMIPFSSVNSVFMLAVVLWITASFALFYIGWAPKGKEADEINDARWTSDDVFMTVAIVWNVAAIVYMLVPDAQVQSNIPLNNVVIAVTALLLTIFVQWRWANFSTEKQDRIAADELKKEDPDFVEETVGGGEERDPDYADYMNSRDQDMKTPISFSTVNFLSTANAVKDYGVQYARRYMPNGGTSHGLRQRKGGYACGTRLSMMPNYTAMINTGSPIVMYNYIRNIKVIFAQEHSIHMHCPSSCTTTSGTSR